MALLVPIEPKLDCSKLMFLMDDGRLRTPREFRRSVTCPEMSLSPRKSTKTRTHVETSRSYPNTANTAGPRIPCHLNQSLPSGRASNTSAYQAPRTPKTAIAYYSPVNKPDTPLSFSASFSRPNTNAGVSTFSRQSTRIWTHSRPSTRGTTSNMENAVTTIPVPTTVVSSNGKELKTSRRKKSKLRTKSNSDPGGLKKMTSKERTASGGSLNSEKSEKSHTGSIFLEAAQKGNVLNVLTQCKQIRISICSN